MSPEADVRNFLDVAKKHKKVADLLLEGRLVRAIHLAIDVSINPLGIDGADFELLRSVKAENMRDFTKQVDSELTKRNL